MISLRRGRFLYRFTREISHKYTKFTFLGIILGSLLVIIFNFFIPKIQNQLFNPGEKIGVIGEFNPSNLPTSIQMLISSGLTQNSKDGSAMPSFAENWEATDSAKTFIFHLKTDRRWHNGKKVTAADINYNIKGVNFNVIDDFTLKATLPSSYSPLPSLVAKPIFKSSLMGFGKYRVERIKLKGDNVHVLKLTPASDLNLKTIEYRFYPTENLAILAFKLGEIDKIEELSSVDTINKNNFSNINTTVNHNRQISLFFNLADYYLKENKGLRQALAYLVPDFAEEKSYSPFSKHSWAYYENIKKYDYDEKKARKLFDAAKLSTTSSELTITTFSIYLDKAQKIADNWTKFGIKTSVKVVSSIENNYQVLLAAQDIPPDPDQYPFWHSTQTASNITGYKNVKIDKLLEDGRQEFDQERRKQIYIDFQKHLIDDLPAVFLYYPKSYSVQR